MRGGRGGSSGGGFGRGGGVAPTAGNRSGAIAPARGGASARGAPKPSQRGGRNGVMPAPPPAPPQQLQAPTRVVAAAMIPLRNEESVVNANARKRRKGKGGASEDATPIMLGTGSSSPDTSGVKITPSVSSAVPQVSSSQQPQQLPPPQQHATPSTPVVVVRASIPMVPVGRGSGVQPPRRYDDLSDAELLGIDEQPRLAVAPHAETAPLLRVAGLSTSKDTDDVRPSGLAVQTLSGDTRPANVPADVQRLATESPADAARSAPRASAAAGSFASATPAAVAVAAPSLTRKRERAASSAATTTANSATATMAPSAAMLRQEGNSTGASTLAADNTAAAAPIADAAPAAGEGGLGTGGTGVLSGTSSTDDGCDVTVALSSAPSGSSKLPQSLLSDGTSTDTARVNGKGANVEDSSSGSSVGDSASVAVPTGSMQASSHAENTVAATAPAARPSRTWGATFGVGIASDAAQTSFGGANSASKAPLAGTVVDSSARISFVSEIPVTSSLNSWFLSAGMPCFDRSAAALSATSTFWAPGGGGRTSAASAANSSVAFSRWVSAAVSASQPVVEVVRNALDDEEKRVQAFSERLLIELRRGMFAPPQP